MKLAKVGDIIEWSFPENHNCSYFAGKTYQAEVSIVTDENYGVYAEYGQDLIPFENAKIIKNEKN